MQSRKSSLVIGSRTRRNVLKGKNVRKQTDGADNFADYWTDSDCASTEGSVTHEETDLSQTQHAHSISNARLGTLRQNVRKSQNSKLPQDELQKSKLTRSPLKSIKNNILSPVKDVNRSLTNKQKISLDQDIHHNRTEIFSNNSALSDGSGSHDDDDEPNVSYNRFKLSTSNANATMGQTKDIANSSLPKTNEALVTQSKVQSSENINEEESIESRASDNSASAASDHGKRTPKKDLNLRRNLSESDNYIEPSSVSQRSTSDANTINTYTENASSPLSKKDTFILQKSVPSVILNTTDIHVLSKTKVMQNAIDPFHFTESSVQPLSGKTLNEKDNIVPPISRVSNVFMTSLGNRTVKKMHNSIQVSKTFEKFDEYDAEIMQMAHENEKNENLKLPEKEHSSLKKLKLSLIEKEKTESSPSKRTVKSTEEALEDKITSEDAVESFNESQRSYNFRSIDKAHNEFLEKENETTPSLLNKRKIPENETFEKLRDSDTCHRLRDKSKNAEIPEVGKPGKRGKGVNKRNESIFQRDDNVQIDISPSKRRKMKKTAANATDNTVPIRKSARQKFPPLSRWRNERPLYRVENGTINFVGIDHGTREDKAIQTIKSGVKAEKRKAKVKKFTLDDAVKKKKIRLSLLKRFVDTPWDKGHEGDKCPYRIKRPVQTFNSAFGYIEIERNAEKPKQYMPEEDLYLSVIKGKLQCTVQNNICVLEEKDVFVIPRCIPYSLKNIGTTKALLIFCVGKFQSVESLE